MLREDETNGILGQDFVDRVVNRRFRSGAASSFRLYDENMFVKLVVRSNCSIRGLMLTSPIFRACSSTHLQRFATLWK